MTREIDPKKADRHAMAARSGAARRAVPIGLAKLYAGLRRSVQSLRRPAIGSSGQEFVRGAPAAVHADFSEDEYLAANPDVAAAVARGEFKSGLDHYTAAGHSGGRPLRRPSRPLFFCHIPKTAGTTVRVALERSVRPFEVVPDGLMMSRQGGHYAPVELAAAVIRHQGPSIKLFRGHYHFSCRALMPNAMTMTILREPVDRVVSHIKHNIRTGAITAEYAKSSLDDGVLPKVADNLMVRYLGGVVDPGPGLADSHAGLLRRPMLDPGARLESAIENLTAVDILGLSEDLAAVAPQIRAAGFRSPSERLNAAPEGLLDLADRHLVTIRKINELDVLLYEAARLEISRRATSSTSSGAESLAS